MAEPRTINRGKSISMIRSQYGRIADAFRDAYYRAENGPLEELDAELDRLNRRIGAVNAAAERYESNITRQPEYEAISEQLRAAYRSGGRSPEEARETARLLEELRNRRNSLRYPRSVYMRNNRG